MLQPHFYPLLAARVLSALYAPINDCDEVKKPSLAYTAIAIHIPIEYFSMVSPQDIDTHACTHARTSARTHAPTHARTHPPTHKHS